MICKVCGKELIFHDILKVFYCDEKSFIKGLNRLDNHYEIKESTKYSNNYFEYMYLSDEVYLAHNFSFKTFCLNQ